MIGKITFGPAFKDFEKIFVGIDDHFDKMTKVHDDLVKNFSEYPKHSLAKIGDNSYVIELALAGFSKENIQVELENDSIVIKGHKKEDEPNKIYVYKGVASRPFTKIIPLLPDIKVKEAQLVDGILSIYVERVAPEKEKAIKIEVKSKPLKSFLKE